MVALSEQRCRNHAQREAVARCPECRRFFCRECVVEHDDRMICTSCLRTLTARETPRRRHLRAVWRFAQCAVSFVILWVAFLMLGRALLNIPTATHESTLWSMPMEAELDEEEDE